MPRLLSLVVLGFAGFSLASPQVSQAAVPIGVSVNVGPARVTYQQGYPAYFAPAPSFVYPTVTEVCAPVYVPPVIVYPVHRHWEHHHHHGAFVPHLDVHVHHRW